MDEIFETIKNILNSEITHDTYANLRKYLKSKLRDDRINAVAKLQNIKIVEHLLSSNEELLECYAVMYKIFSINTSDKIYEILMEEQEEDLVLKYFNYLDYDFLKINLLIFLHTDEKIMKYITNCSNDADKCLLAKILTNDQNKYRCLEYFQDDYNKSFVIESIQDEHLRAKALMTLIPGFRLQVASTITNQEILKDLYEKNKGLIFRPRLLCLIHDDNLKQEELKLYNIYDQINIISSIDCEMILQKIIWDSKYDYFCQEFIGKITDETFLIKYLNKNNDLNFKIKVINSVNEISLKKKLISLLEDTECQEILLGNIIQIKERLLQEKLLDNLVFDIDPKITIGIELEVCCNNSKPYLELQKILCDWKIKLDRTVLSGIEITSPVLNYNHKSLTELKFICDFLKKYNFYVNDTCGGHIHLGFAYFDNLDEFKVFLNLYQGTEDLLYLISNRQETIIRPNIDKYAQRLKPVLKKINDLNINLDKVNELRECVTLIKENCGSRYYGLNLYNAFGKLNTIEFRMPNGEIEFQEILLNIRLFAKYLEVSKKINTIIKKSQLSSEEQEILNLYYRLSSGERNNSDKLDDLLNLLFKQSEQDAYRRRYSTNRKCNKVRKKKILIIDY